jgi:hypothetical protein
MKSDRKYTATDERTGESGFRNGMKPALLNRRADLSAQLKELNSAISGLREEFDLKIERLQARKRPLEEALYHIEALLRLEEHHGSKDTISECAAPATAARLSLTDAAYDLLEEYNQPMHYRDIAATLQERDNYIPGKDPAATLLSRMCRDKRFKRTGRQGMYAPSTWRLPGRTSRKVPSKAAGAGVEDMAGSPIPVKQSILQPPWNRDIETVWDLMTSGRARNQVSLFASGICYGSGS